MRRVRDFGTFSSKWGVSIKSFPMKFGERCGGGGRNSMICRESGDNKKTSPSKSAWPKLIWIYRDWNHMQRVFTGLHQLLQGCIMASRLVFLWEREVCKWEGLWDLCLLLGSFSCVSLYCPTSLWWFCLLLLYYFSYMLLFSVRTLLFSNERQKGSGSGLEMKWGGTRSSSGRRNHNLGILYEKIAYI